MSRTYKTRPGWLVEYQDGVVDHDHRRGECHVQSLADVRRRTSAPRWWHPRERCSRWQIVYAGCPGHLLCPLAAVLLAQLNITARESGDRRAARRLASYTAYRPWRCPGGHPVWVPTGLECGRCDAEAARRVDIREPVCVRRLPAARSPQLRAIYGRRQCDPVDRRHTEGATRAQVRDVLRAAMADYATYGDTDIQPEPTRHRHKDTWW